MVGDGTLRALLPTLSRLQSLKLRCCSGITDVGLLLLASGGTGRVCEREGVLCGV